MLAKALRDNRLVWVKINMGMEHNNSLGENNRTRSA
ncbi:Uncharacterised protein [Vibrio cholerae]|nr:Uncharacterised protein [Vibrio cholerae]